ncbi:MAG: bifunctional UDP-3-O-[3-hydroxymyristoyl] N-acetylglucosamine deacetylase/3-hydroxyacyl-ACP dehydratase [Candidatus Eisenbacteria bacterium]|nr:bifunctional UDP-3-O-[3-hydroxymyristoyl] N-acetylglucosamine deacetylase/3-hydroxyacyl-ACP dehydratase [Candidatus Eisenbacteria bacterium]
MGEGRQQTIAQAVTFEGRGLHTGGEHRLTLRPADVDSGVRFVRADLSGRPVVRVTLENAVSDTGGLRRTMLRQGEAEIHTVEHLLAAVAGLRIDNLTIELDGPEVPEPSDGSAAPFADLLLEAGLTEQPAAREPFVIREPVVYQHDGVEIAALPSPGLQLAFTIQFDNPVLGTQHLSLELTPESFRREIAPARTFVLYRDVEALRARGLIQGGSLRNAVVVRDDGIMNEEPLRFADEFVRHKLLDLLGDLFLLGRPIQGHIRASRSGHMHNLRFLRDLVAAHDQAAEHRRLLDELHFDINEIEAIMPHRYPFLLVDRILYLRERERVVGLKNVTVNEPFFAGHFPGHPIMPAVLIIEAMAQVGGVLLLNTVDDPASKLVYFMGIDNAKFRRPVVPGDQLLFDLQLLRLKSRTCKMTGKAYVQGRLVAEAELLSSIVDRKESPRP